MNEEDTPLSEEDNACLGFYDNKAGVYPRFNTNNPVEKQIVGNEDREAYIMNNYETIYNNNL